MSVPSQAAARCSLTIFLRHNFNNRARVSSSGGVGVFVFETLSLVSLLLSVTAVLVAALDTPRRFQHRSLEQPCHEGQTIAPDERLTGEGVKHRVYAAADKGHGRGEHSQNPPVEVRTAG